MLKLKPKQQQVIELAKDPSIHTIVLLGSVGCFSAGTLVQTPQGGVPIEKLKLGDVAYSFDGESIIENKVTYLSGSVDYRPKPMLQFKYEDVRELQDKRGFGKRLKNLRTSVSGSKLSQNKIKATFDHPFMDAEDGKYYPLYEFVWRELEESQRLQLKLLCEQYGQNLDLEPSWGITHSDNETRERRIGLSENSSRWKNSKSSQGGSSDLDKKPQQIESSKSQRYKSDQQQSRESGVVYPQPELKTRLRPWEGEGKSGKSKEVSAKSHNRQGSGKNVGVVGRENKGSTQKLSKKRRFLSRVVFDVPKDKIECDTKCHTTPQKLFDIQILEAEPYYAIGVEKPHTYFVGDFLPVHNTGKTDIAAHLSLSIAYQFPKTYWTVFRKNISTAKRSVIPSYLEMLDKMNLYEGSDFKYNRQDFEITFSHNQSKISFIEGDTTRDRQARKIKGINATGNHIDEADELEEIIYATATSRRGRRNESGQPSLSIITMNPNSTFLKQKIYDKWKEGKLEKGVAVIEFTLEDSWQSEQDIEAMKQHPKPWRERYLYNNWEYEDDSENLFKYRYFDSAIVKQLDENAVRTVGYDVARSGSDRSVIALWYGKTLADIVIVKDKDEQMTTDEQALELIKYITQNAVLAENTAVDAVGVGVGVVDNMRPKGIFVKEFVSGAKPTSQKYDNLRSEVIYTFSQGLEKGEIKIYENCSFRNEIISEAMLHQHKVTEKLLSVESKDSIKKRTGGMSPDIFDAVVYGLFPQLDLDEKNSARRIIL